MTVYLKPREFQILIDAHSKGVLSSDYVKLSDTSFLVKSIVDGTQIEVRPDLRKVNTEPDTDKEE